MAAAALPAFSAVSLAVVQRRRRVLASRAEPPPVAARDTTDSAVGPAQREA
jgi:hypothetical protein